MAICFATYHFVHWYTELPPPPHFIQQRCTETYGCPGTTSMKPLDGDAHVCRDLVDTQGHCPICCLSTWNRTSWSPHFQWLLVYSCRFNRACVIASVGCYYLQGFEVPINILLLLWFLAAHAACLPATRPSFLYKHSLHLPSPQNTHTCQSLLLPIILYSAGCWHVRCQSLFLLHVYCCTFDIYEHGADRNIQSISESQTLTQKLWK